MWLKYHLWYFKIVSNFTRLTAREITYKNYHSWYLCQISLQIMLLPIRILKPWSHFLKLCSLYQKAFTTARKPYRIWLLFTHKDTDFGAISLTERSCAAPISKGDVDLLTSRACERVARQWAQSAIIRAGSASEPGPTTPDQKTKRTTLRKSKGDVTRDDSQRRFSAQHSVATLLRHCFEWLQHCSSIATMSCAKNRCCESSGVASP